MPIVTTAAGMKIGELAGRCGLPVKTLRFYEDEGLLHAVGRSSGGYRLFGEESLQRLEFILRLKALGLSLEEIRESLAVHDGGRLPCADIQRQPLAQIERIDARMSELRQLRKHLHQTLQGWQAEPMRESDQICPNLKV